jgi:hypothetical protein
MTILLSARQERFAQGLAEGKTQAEAYIEAGYSPKNARANASTLLRDSPRILARRDELLSCRAECNLAVVSEIAVQSHCTLEQHLSTLAQLRDEARAKGDYSSAISAEYKRGQVLGFYIQRSEAGKPGDFSDLSDEELMAKIKAYEAIDKAKDTTHGQLIELPKRDH